MRRPFLHPEDWIFEVPVNSPDALVVGAGQAGLAAARSLLARGLNPVVLEAGPEPVGSWPRYYDSLVLFSPARYSALPGLPFPGDPDRYPHRDEVVDYLPPEFRKATLQACAALNVAFLNPAGADRIFPTLPRSRWGDVVLHGDR